MYVIFIYLQYHKNLPVHSLLIATFHYHFVHYLHENVDISIHSNSNQITKCRSQLNLHLISIPFFEIHFRRLLVYLIGDYSLYYENQNSIHEMPSSAVATALSNMCRHLAWQLLTDHVNFEAGRWDTRYIGTKGVVSRRELKDDEDEQIEFDEYTVFGSVEMDS